MQGRWGCLCHYLLFCNSSVPLVSLQRLFGRAFGMPLGLLWCRLLSPSVPGNAKIPVESSRGGTVMWVLLYCCRCCCVSFPFPPGVQPGQRFGSCEAVGPVQPPLPSLARHRRTQHRRAERSPAVRGCHGTGCEGRDASLRGEAELGACGGTQWLGFHHAWDEFCLAA